MEDLVGPILIAIGVASVLVSYWSVQEYVLRDPDVRLMLEVRDESTKASPVWCFHNGSCLCSFLGWDTRDGLR